MFFPDVERLDSGALGEDVEASRPLPLEDSMHARVSFYELAGASQDDAVRAFEAARSAVEQMQGNQGAMLLVNSQSGKAMTITLWENEDALRGTEQQANQARQQAASSAGMTITGVEAYEVALEFGR